MMSLRASCLAFFLSLLVLLPAAGQPPQGKSRFKKKGGPAAEKLADPKAAADKLPLSGLGPAKIMPNLCVLKYRVTTQSLLCKDLVSNVNASRGAAAAEAAHCFAQLTNLGGLGDTCRLAMRDPADATAQALIQKAQSSFAGDLSVALPEAFARIGAWWPAVAALAHGDLPWLLGEQGTLLRWLWSTIEAQSMPLPPQKQCRRSQCRRRPRPGARRWTGGPRGRRRR